jgi:hypothetical protein
MAKQPEAVKRIRRKVAAVKAGEVEVESEAPPEVEASASLAEPQSEDWCCHVCGNQATYPVCTVDGARRSTHE